MVSDAEWGGPGQVTGSSSLCPMQTICAWGSLQRGAPVPSLSLSPSWGVSSVHTGAFSPRR